MIDKQSPEIIGESHNAEMLPVNVIRIIRDFPKPHEDFFLLAQKIPTWARLVITDSALALIVARAWQFDGLPQNGAFDRICKYVLLQPIKICKAMGFPENDRTIRILSRFHICQKDSVKYLLLLRDLLNYESAAFDVLDFSTTISHFELNHLAFGREAFGHYQDTASLGWYLNLPAALRHYIGCLYAKADEQYTDTAKDLLGGIKPLDCFHNAIESVSYLKRYICEKTRIEEAEEQLSCSFGTTWPPPPIPGTARIVPIQSLADFDAVTQKFRHHTFSTQRILIGEYYVYQLQSKPSYLIGVEFVNNSWVLDIFCGENNVTCTEDQNYSMIIDWLLSAPALSKSLPDECRQKYLQNISRNCGISVNRDKCHQSCQL